MTSASGESCRRVYDVDLAAFLARPRDVEFDRFRAHYPTCPDCAPEVRAWTELDRALHGGAEPFDHPAPELLLAWQDARHALAASDLEHIERHLPGCASCREELRGLQVGLERFEQRIAAPVPPPRPGLLARLRGRLRVVVLHPAFAWSLVGLLLYPAVYAVLSLNLGPAPGAPPPLPPPRSAPRADAPGLTHATGGERIESAPHHEAPAQATSELPGTSFSGGVERTPTALDSARGVMLARDVPLDLERPASGTPLQLRIPSLRGAPRGGALDLRVVSPDGQRERRARAKIPLDGSPVPLRIPSDWLEPGSYRIEARFREPRAEGDTLVVFRLRIHPAGR